MVDRINFEKELFDSEIHRLLKKMKETFRLILISAEEYL